MLYITIQSLNQIIYKQHNLTKLIQTFPQVILQNEYKITQIKTGRQIFHVWIDSTIWTIQFLIFNLFKIEINAIALHQVQSYCVNFVFYIKTKAHKNNIIMDTEDKRFKYSRTVIILPGILLFLFLTANSLSGDFVQATRKALGFAIVASILIGCLFLPTGFIHKPTPYLWKGISGASFFYLSVLIYFLYLDKNSTLHIIKTYFDPNLSQTKYSQTSYAQDCRIYAPQKQNPWANVSHSFFDLFALAHTAGWFFKTLVCRDLKLIIFSSITFQLIEYALRDVLNNFKECWWDHVIVDALGCNLIGIVLGFYFIDKFGLERYKWSLRSAPMQNSLWSNIKYFWANWNLNKLQTKAFTSVKKFLQMTWFILFIQVNDLALFFLKYIYQIPTENFLVIFRTFLVSLLCVNAAKEYYRFISQKQREIKVNCFMVNMIVFTEWFIIYKHKANDFDHAFINPLGKVFLCSLFALFLVFLIKISVSDIINFRDQYLNINQDLQIVKKGLQQLYLFSGIAQNPSLQTKDVAKQQNPTKIQNSIKPKSN